MTRRVWDCFLFAGELDLLEARLIELDSAAYRHVLVEAPVTFQGGPKPLHYQENRDRFAPWKNKIIHLVAGLDGLPTCWAREHAQRETIWQGLDGLGPDDIFMLSDVDEIPRADVCQRLPGRTLFMRHHPVAVNLLDPSWWPGTAATLGRPVQSMKTLRGERATPRAVPLQGAHGAPLVAGWHFSWLGGPGAMRAKAGSFAHPDQAARIDAEADRIYAERIHPAEPETRLLVTHIDDSWPAFMRERQGPASWYWPGGSA